MPVVFISYRRDDTAGAVGRLYDRLAARFGSRDVFLDVDAIPRGVDFREQMMAAVRASDVFLLVIGDEWLGDDPSRPRIMSPEDYVRQELEAALEHAVPVIPVLVGGAAMPAADQLPESLGGLVYLNAAVLRLDQDFQPHSARLIEDIEKAAKVKIPASGKSSPSRAKWLTAAGVVAGVALLAIMISYLPIWNQTPSGPPPAGQPTPPPTSADNTSTTATGDQASAAEQQQPPIAVAPFDPHRDLRAYGAVEFRPAMAQIAKRINEVLREQGTFQVTVGAFAAPPQFSASGGPQLQKLLQEELQRLSITIKNRADWSVAGEYRIVSTPAGEQEALAVEILVRLVDSFGGALAGLNTDDAAGALRVRVLNDRLVCHLAGASVALPPAGTPAERSQRLMESLRDPVLAVDDNCLLAGRGNPYLVEFRSGEKSLAPEMQEGMAFLPLDNVEQFEIVLHNNSDYHAAAQVTIDGLNVFDFSELTSSDGRPLFQELIIRPSSSATLKGWHITHQRAWPFSAKSYPESAASLLAAGPDFATVTVTFAAAWPVDASPPPDEPAADATATGAGAILGAAFQPVRMKLGVVRAAVSGRFARP